MLIDRNVWLDKYKIKYRNQPIPPDVFHIGYHKTGTTFIQRSILSQLSDEQRFCVFSNERISGHDFKDDLECGNFLSEINPNAKIIITIRSHITMFPSNYWLYVKEGGTLSIDDFIKKAIENRRFDYYALYCSLLNYFPPEKILILPFELLKHNKKQFIDTYLSFSFDQFDTKINYDTPPENPSPGLFAVNFVRRVNLLMGHISALKFLRSTAATKTGWIEKIFFNRKVKIHKGVSPQSMQKINKFYKLSNRSLQNYVPYDLEEMGYPI